MNFIDKKMRASGPTSRLLALVLSIMLLLFFAIITYSSILAGIDS